jgi:Aerotolerance regulator N-terminal/von Willebrand factor type A domain/CARDB
MSPWNLIGLAGFASAWMLLWGAAAAIPIVLHLLNRRRQQTVTWAAMRLLLQVIEKQSKRVRIEQLILLLLRTLILLTLGVSLARPYFEPQVTGETVAAQRPPRLWVLVLDNSYSMGYRDEQGTRFAAAQARAVEIVRASGRGDAFGLITLSAPSETLIYRPTFDVDVTIAAIQKIHLLDCGAELDRTLAQAVEMIAEAGRNPDIPTDIHVVFLSDFGQDTWQEALGSGRSQRPLKQLAAAQTLVYESFSGSGNNAPANLATLAMTTSASSALKDRPLDVEITVTNFGASEAKQVPLQLSANGQTVASQVIDLPAGMSRVVHLNVQPNASGLMTLAASLPDDRLTADNQRQSVIEVRSGFKVLCVENPYSDSRILKTALQPPVAGQTAMQVTSTTQLELNSVDLTEFDAIVLNDVTNLSETEFAELTQFVATGRSLVCLLGQNTDISTWNMLLGNARNPLGFRLTEPSEFSDWRIDPLDYSSPIAAPFASHPDAGLLTTPIFRFWKIQVSENVKERPQVELQMQDAAPLLVLNRWGKGRVASLLSAPQTGAMRGALEPWNAMATWPSFLPLMQQLVQATFTDSAAQFNLNVGQPISATQRATGDRALIEILRPDGNVVELQASEVDENGMRSWSYAGTTHRGFYQVTTEGSLPRPYAVNIIPNQSDLRSIPVEQLPKATEKSTTPVAVTADNQPTNPSSTLVRWLLGMLVVMLVAESCLAWTLGRRLA